MLHSERVRVVDAESVVSYDHAEGFLAVEIFFVDDVLVTVSVVVVYVVLHYFVVLESNDVFLLKVNLKLFGFE